MTAGGLTARSPLEGAGLPAEVAESPFVSHLDIRADQTDGALLARLAAALGVGLPIEPNTFTETVDGSRTVLWLGPDEWLVLAPPGSAPDVESALRAALAGGEGAVVDVSANRTTLSIAGPRARAILERGCSIDLHPRVFGPGRCAQTDLARANVILFQVSAEPEYRILVRPSFAAYLAAWLADAFSD